MTLNKAKFVWLTGSMVLVGALIACGDEKAIDDGTDPTVDGGSSGSSGDNDGGSSGNNDGGSSGTIEIKGGTISLSQTVTKIDGQPDVVNSSASASFYQGTVQVTGNPDTRCTTVDEGSCKVTVCDFTGPVPDAGTLEPESDAGAFLLPHAGDITIGATPITLTPTSDGQYATKLLAERIWNTEDFTVKAAGATVPAFEKLLQAPADIAVTAPALPALPEKALIKRSEDLAVTWTGGGAGVVRASAVTSAIDGATMTKSASAICSFPSAGGTGTIPAAALAKLLPGDGSFSVSPALEEQLDVEGWKITINAIPGGSGKTGQVTIE